MKVKTALVAALVALSPLGAKADLVDWSMIGGAVYTDASFSSTLNNAPVAFGTFGTGYDFTGKSYSTLVSDFTTWATGNTDGAGQFYITSATTTGPNGTPWAFFLGSSASSFGVFLNPAWVNSGDIFLQFADLSDPGTFAASATTGTVSAPNVAVVPEPSTYALLAMGAGLVGWIARRRKNS